MTNLTKEKALELNILFVEMLNLEHSKKTLSFVNVVSVSKEIPILKDKTDSYIKHLLYIARLEQKNIPELFSGDTLISINEPSVRDFLKQGGFLTLYKKHKSEKRKDNFRFWSIFIITAITLVATIYQVLLSDKASPSGIQIEKQLYPMQKPVHQDSTKIQDPKTNPMNDSTK